MHKRIVRSTRAVPAGRNRRTHKPISVPTRIVILLRSIVTALAWGGALMCSTPSMAITLHQQIDQLDYEIRHVRTADAQACSELRRRLGQLTTDTMTSDYASYVRQSFLNTLNRAGEELNRRCPVAETAQAGILFDVTVELGGSATTTSPQLFEPFSIASGGFVAGGSLGAQVPLPGTPLLIGVQGSVLGFSGNSGSKIFVPTDERFTAKIRSMETAGLDVGIAIADPYGTSPQGPVSLFFYGQVGGAWGQVNVSSPVASVDETLSGWSAGVGVKIPAVLFMPQLGPGTMIGFQWRHYDISGNVPLFGPGSDVHVNQHGDIFTGTLTLPIPDPIWVSMSRVQRNLYP